MNDITFFMNNVIKPIFYESTFVANYQYIMNSIYTQQR
jgi:hypothetical protein